tara:strand:- start:204 stop:440 length:237 start_codon:yes stop_codon:yes gene_type:complete
MEDLKKLFWKLVIGEGLNLAPKKVYEKRMDICRSNVCNSYKKPLKLKILEKCAECGCMLQIKTKIQEDFIECPKKLWS